MKKIEKEKFELLYEKLNEHLEKTNGNFKTLGIYSIKANEILTELWENKETWKMICFIVAYHYSRTDSVIMQFQFSQVIINHMSSVAELEKIFGIRRERLKYTTIDENEFEKKFIELWSMLKEYKNIENPLRRIGIEHRSLLKSYWKQGYKWETIAAIIISQKLKIYDKLLVETKYGKFNFNKDQR